MKTENFREGLRRYQPLATVVGGFILVAGGFMLDSAPSGQPADLKSSVAIAAGAGLIFAEVLRPDPDDQPK